MQKLSAPAASTITGWKSTQEDDFDGPYGLTKFVGECDLPTDKGMFRLRSYRYQGMKIVSRCGETVQEYVEMEPVVIYKGKLEGNTQAVVRVHDQCFTSEVMGSKRCDCKEQLDLALEYIQEHGGAVVYMPQEGRGIGLAYKVAAYELQDGGLDTVDANRHLGFGDDERSYGCIPYILKDMGIKGVQLVTNNPFKIMQLTDLGVNIVGRMPSLVPANKHNEQYLRTKASRMAHAISFDDDAANYESTAQSQEGSTATVPSSSSSSSTLQRFGALSVARAITAMAKGQPVVVVNKEGTEGGVLCVGAAKASESTLAMLMQHGGGMVMAPMSRETHDALCKEGASLRLASDDPASPAAAPFSPTHRALTLRELAAPSARAHHFSSPGYVVPIRVGDVTSAARERAEEAAVDLAELAGLSPVAATTELVAADRLSRMSLEELVSFAEEHKLVVTSAEDIAHLRAASA